MDVSPYLVIREHVLRFISEETIHMSRWKRTEVVHQGPFLPRHSTGKPVGRPARCKEWYSLMCECWSTCLSNLWLARMRRHYVMAPPLPPETINTRAHWGSGIHSRSGVRRIGNPGLDLETSDLVHRVVHSLWDLTRSPRRSFKSNRCYSCHSCWRSRVTRHRHP